MKGEMANRSAANQDTLNSIREKLDQFHKELTSLRDSLDDALKNIARANETNTVNQKLLEDYKVRQPAHTNIHADTVSHKERFPAAYIKTRNNQLVVVYLASISSQ